MSEDQRITKSFDFAADVTKQLITLSTAIISLCVAFTDKIFSSSAAQSHSTVLLIALLLFVASIIFGIITLMALAGHLGRPKQKTSTESQSLQQGQQVNQQQNQHRTYKRRKVLFIKEMCVSSPWDRCCFSWQQL